MGFPGFGSFISEYMVILSSIKVNLVLAVTVLVPALTSGYFVWMLRRVLIQSAPQPRSRNEAPTYELLTLAAFLAPLLLLGLFPAPILLLIDSTVKSLTGLGLQ
jgi:NADH:ubiquinone oxidoreductase subunit 4 (subunit M)